ncbi:MAG: ATP phosphoribosyltransferase regulatory subunit [Phycisphaerae bacterium]|nr:ATP phosphoribosyltransferase regulatory subunit [Phycisphaerae bacterium]
MPDPAQKKRTIQPPTGTRDFYPREMLVRRYITDAWRRTALRHGFDEIDGPTFESADLYKVKSGEGILNEMFGVFSGKSAEDIEAVKRGEPPFGLRPEFTPTLARMYAARAKQLPQPTKWFCVSNFFRAERPQRGRLREFWQWNADVVGGNEMESDGEVIHCIAGLVSDLGMAPETARIHLSDRRTLDGILAFSGVPEACRDECIAFLDKRAELSSNEVAVRSGHMSFDTTRFDTAIRLAPKAYEKGTRTGTLRSTVTRGDDERTEAEVTLLMAQLITLRNHLEILDIHGWVTPDFSIVRGLAYYTGTVFEVIAEGERAVAGGGRYDNLIELFGGPPTPACGFGMGDAVLGNLLEDRKLIPEGREMLEALARPMPYRPDVFVIASPNPGCEELIVPTVARLRRGEESEQYKQGGCKPWSAERYTVPPLHARRSYKATKNVGKLLADAGACHARFAAIIETPETCTLKNLDTGEQTPDVPLGTLASGCR